MAYNFNDVISGFSVSGDVISCAPCGNGHINTTFRVELDNNGQKKDYILQKINKNVFKKPDILMENYVGVTEFLKKKIKSLGGDSRRETINVIKSKDGKSYFVDREGEYWRLIKFVFDSVCYDKVERPEQFYDSAVAFGHFQSLLSDYPAHTLHETIPNFHNTPDRLRLFEEAVSADVCSRAAEVSEEINFVRERAEFAATLERAHNEGKLPIKVTHNDTKLNNILFDAESGERLA